MLLLSFLPIFLSGVGASLFSDDSIDQIETQLSETCGRDCVDIFHQVIPMLTNASQASPTSDWTYDRAKVENQFSEFNNFMSNIISKSKQEHSRILSELHNLTSFMDQSPTPPEPTAGDSVYEALVKNATASSNSTKGSIRPHQPQLPPDEPGVPCSTQAECAAMDYKVNRCYYIRQAAMKAYVGANAAVSVLANLIAGLCGCIFAGTSKICVLQGIPYTCGFPFVAYMSLYGVSLSLWSAVKTTSTVCSSVGTDQML